MGVHNGPEYPQAEQMGGKRVIVIGASTGGPMAVAEVLAGLGRDFPVGVLVVQHMAQEFIPSFVERLKWGCSLEI